MSGDLSVILDHENAERELKYLKVSSPWIDGCRVLVAQDASEKRDIFVSALMRHGNQVDTASTLDEIVSSIDDVDAVVIDMKLSSVHNLVVCNEIRAKSRVPILLMADQASEMDCILGIQAGADDYLVSPVGILELMVRIAARNRRLFDPSSREKTVISHDDLTIDPSSRRVQVSNQSVSLTRKEFDMLHLLAINPSQVVTREKLLVEVWGGTWSRRTLDTHVSSVRNKLGCSDWIVTVRGIGFKLGEPRKVLTNILA